MTFDYTNNLSIFQDGCLLTPNEYFLPSMTALRSHGRTSTPPVNSSRMICLNCSQCHAEIQESCVPNPARRQDRSSRPRSPPIRPNH